MAPRKRYPVPDLAKWSQPRYQINWRPKPNNFHWNDNLRPTEFYDQNVLFEDDPSKDVLWVYQRELGSGGFGLVGLWEKKDNSNETVDSLAVKEMVMPGTNVYRLLSDGKASGRFVPEEAIIQTALQKKSCIPVVQMRGMNLINVPETYYPRVRFYLEFCSNGSLSAILRDYYYRSKKIYDSFEPSTQSMEESQLRSESIPEPFLWQVLYNFAQVLSAMEEAPFDHPRNGKMGENPYILHFDVKAGNIMLSETDDEDIIKGYPSSKVGDWGVAKLTSLTDSRNSGYFSQLGTRGWHPPEQYNRGRFCKDFQQTAPWRDLSKPDSHAYTTAHSVFAFASVMWRLMTLDANGALLETILDEANCAEQECWDRNFKYITASDLDRDVFELPNNYSFLLRDTVANCLNLNPASRPHAGDLERLARDECVRVAQQITNGQTIFTELHSPEPIVPELIASSSIRRREGW